MHEFTPGVVQMPNLKPDSFTPEQRRALEQAISEKIDKAFWRTMNHAGEELARARNELDVLTRFGHRKTEGARKLAFRIELLEVMTRAAELGRDTIPF